MNTFFRILMIVAAFTLVMGLVYAVVSTTSSSAGFADSQRFNPSNGERPGHFERDQGDGGGLPGIGWIVGLVKNLGIVAVIISLVVGTKNFRQRKRQAVPVRIQ